MDIQYNLNYNMTFAIRINEANIIKLRIYLYLGYNNQAFEVSTVTWLWIRNICIDTMLQLFSNY